jgi:hypothetical protein
VSPTISLHTPNIDNESENIFSQTTYFSVIVGYKSRVVSLFSSHYGVSTYKYTGYYLQFSKIWFENESFLDFAYHYHTCSMFMFSILCIRKRETVSYLQYVYVLDFLYQKEGSCIIPTICLCSRFRVSERGKLYHTYYKFII